jgi:hypothetical protein
LWGSVTGGNGCLYANIVDTEGTHHYLVSASGLLTPGVWQNVALTYDGSVGTIYLNGTPVTSEALGSFTPLTSFNLLVGGRTTFGSVQYPRNSFSGQIDELSIYGRALTQEEILSLTIPEPTTGTLLALGCAFVLSRFKCPR